MLVNILIKFINIEDGFTRYTGMAIDESLVSGWWVNNPSQSIGVIDGSTTKSFDIELSEGSHTIEVGISSPSIYPWNAEVYIQDSLINSGIIHGGAFVFASFNVGIEEVTPVIALKPIDMLRNLFQRAKSFFLGEESAQAYR